MSLLILMIRLRGSFMALRRDIGEDFEDYKLKVERYLKDYADTLVIYKLRSNNP